ncbi:MAG: SGNH/GDSL hydrolase family protein [Eubacteriales bacterium]|nr:SGNH/GDSL hydrolase family protein [Eubacteriales bacterium]
MKLMCIGDSLTFGSIGYSFIQYLKPELKAINRGINGETTFGAYKRLQKYIENPRYSEIQTYIIFIGTNDILMPYLSTLSPFWKLQMQARIALKKCIEDDDAFAALYENMLQLLTKNHINAVLVGLPMIQMEGISLKKIQARNDSIKKLAERYGMAYIDTYSLQQWALKSPLRLYSWGTISILRILDAMIMFVFPFSKNLFSKARRLELTVDGVHFNSLSAKLIASEVNKCVY